jgi:flagellar capping protein FliD
MTARQLIKQIERAIEESGELDPELVVNTKTQLTGRIEVVATPLEQGEQEYYVVLNLLENAIGEARAESATLPHQKEN